MTKTIKERAEDVASELAGSDWYLYSDSLQQEQVAVAEQAITSALLDLAYYAHVDSSSSRTLVREKCKTVDEAYSFGREQLNMALHSKLADMGVKTDV